MKEIYLKGSNEEIDKCLEIENIEVRIVSDVEIGKSLINIKKLREKKEIIEAISVDMVGRNSVFLEIAVKLMQTKLNHCRILEQINGGACVIEGDE